MNLELPPQFRRPAAEHDNGVVLSGIIMHNGERRRGNFTSSDDMQAERSCSQAGIGLGFTHTEDTRVEDSGSRTCANGGSTASPSPVNSLRDRVGCFTWNWFTMTMATGGIANVLFSSTSTQP